MVGIRKEVWAASALVEVCTNRGMQRFLDVAAVEIIVWAAAKRGETKFVIEIGAVFSEVINVEARIHIINRIINIVI